MLLFLLNLLSTDTDWDDGCIILSELSFVHYWLTANFIRWSVTTDNQKISTQSVSSEHYEPGLERKAERGQRTPDVLCWSFYFELNQLGVPVFSSSLIQEFKHDEDLNICYPGIPAHPSPAYVAVEICISISLSLYPYWFSLKNVQDHLSYIVIQSKIFRRFQMICLFQLNLKLNLHPLIIDKV